MLLFQAIYGIVSDNFENLRSYNLFTCIYVSFKTKQRSQIRLFKENKRFLILKITSNGRRRYRQTHNCLTAC